MSTETREAQGRTATVDRFLKNLDNSDLDVEEAPTDEEDSEDSSEEASAQVELEPGVDDRGGDPVRTYLRQMGAAPLLTREGEVSIARRIERGRRLIRRTIFANPVALREIVTLAEQVGGGARSIREICTVDDGDDGQGAKGSDALIAQLKSFEDLAARVESARARLRPSGKTSKSADLRTLTWAANRLRVEAVRVLRAIPFTSDEIDRLGRLVCSRCREMEQVERRLEEARALSAVVASSRAEEAKRLREEVRQLEERLEAMQLASGSPCAEMRAAVERIRRGSAIAGLATKELVEANLRLV
ncbi:MAG: hypothetical protein KDC27_01255, partial [Acidobacteria bacterium]|nr:hypothetical protein [Acidobacteriota bacterium]